MPIPPGSHLILPLVSFALVMVGIPAESRAGEVAFTVASCMADGSDEPHYAFQRPTLAGTFADRISTRPGFSATVVKTTDWRNIPEGTEPARHVSLVHVHLGRRHDFLALVFGGPRGSINFVARAMALDQTPPKYWFLVPAGERQIERNAPIDLIAHFANQYPRTLSSERPVVTLRLEPWLQTGGGINVSAPTDAELTQLLPLVAGATCAAGLSPTFEKTADTLTVRVDRQPAAYDIDMRLRLGGEECRVHRCGIRLDDVYDMTHILTRRLLHWGDALIDTSRVADGPARPVAVATTDDNRTLVLFSGTGALRARNPVTGEADWEIVQPPNIRGEWRFAALHMNDSPVQIYFGARWRRRFDQSVDPVTGVRTPLPAVVGETLPLVKRGDRFAVAERRTLRLFSAGEESWSKGFTWPVTAGPALTDAFVVAATADKRVHGLRIKDRVEVWTTETDAALKGRLALIDQMILGSTHGGRLYALHASDGSTVWSRDLGDLPLQPPDRVGQNLLVLAGTNRLLALDFATGKTLASREWPTWLIAARVVDRENRPRLLCLDQRKRLCILSWPELKTDRELHMPHRLTPAILECPALPLPWGAKSELAEAEHVAIICDEKGFVYMLGLEE